MLSNQSPLAFPCSPSTIFVTKTSCYATAGYGID